MRFVSASSLVIIFVLVMGSHLCSAGWLPKTSNIINKLSPTKSQSKSSGSGYVKSNSAGTIDGRVKAAHEKHPDLAEKLDAIVDKLTTLHDEVKTAGCKTCNNLAGTLDNAKSEVYSIYRTLADEAPYNSKGKVESIFKSFMKNYDNRIKWRVPQNAQGKEWLNRWKEIKADFEKLKPEILKVAK